MVEKLNMESENAALRQYVAELEARLSQQSDQSQKDLVRMNERFELAVSAASLAVWDWDIEKDELVWDDHMYRLYGVEKEQHPRAYQNWLNGLHPDDLPASYAISQAALRGEKPYDTEFRVVWPDGSIRYIKAHGQVIRDGDGHPLRMTGINYDITESKRATEAVHRSAALYRAIARSIPDGAIFVVDCDLRYIVVEGALAEDIGMPREQLEGKLLAEVLGGTFLTVVSQRFRQALAGEKNSYESKFAGRDIWSQYAPLEGEDGKIVGAMVLTLDITERKRSQERLKQLKRLYATLSQVNQAIVRVREPQVLYDQISQIAVDFGEFQLAWVGLVDYASGEVKPCAWYARNNEECLIDYVHNLHINIYDEHFAETPTVKAIRQSEVVTVNDIAQHRELSRWREIIRSFGLASLAAIPFFQAGEPVGVVVVYGEETSAFEEDENMLLEEISMDISFGLDTMAVEAQHRAAEERFSKAFQSNPAAMSITRLGDGQIIDINQGFERAFGYTRAEVLGKTAFELQLVPQPLSDQEMFERINLQQNHQNFEALLRVKQGEVRSFLVSVEEIDLHGDACVIATMYDITDRKHAEEKIKSALGEKETLLREVHHRVKNNLQSMIALMNMKADQISDADNRQFLKELEGQARTMALVYEQLYQSETLSQVAMAPYLEQLTSNIIQSTGLEYSVFLDLQVDPLFLDVAWAMPFGLIVNELVTNVLKHAFPRGFTGWPSLVQGEDQAPVWRPQIKIELREEEGSYRLMVADNGAGFPPGFDWKASSTLGLRLVTMWATHQLGGSLDVAGGQGTTFTIRIARKEPL